MAVNYQTLFKKTRDLTLLFVEDYAPLRNDMAEIFEDLFKTVEVAADGKEGFSVYQAFYAKHEKNFDIVMTDIQMPLMNGVALSKEIHKVNPDQQIIVLSAHTDSEYLLELINTNISQFLTKPIEHESLMEVLCMVSNKVNENREDDPEDLVLIDLGEDYLWDTETSILQKGETVITLTRNEILLMQLLVRKKEQICTNEDILNDFYANNIDISETSIRNMVFKLRKKLPSSAISSIYAMGYKLTTHN